MRCQIQHTAAKVNEGVRCPQAAALAGAGSAGGAGEDLNQRWKLYSCTAGSKRTSVA